jgi:thioredoxin 1
MGSNVPTVSDADFQREVLQTGQPVIVDFTARWCAPCRVLAVTLDALAAEHAGRVKVVKLDVEDSPRTAQQYGVRSMPTLLFFKSGQVVGQVVGAVPRARLEEVLQRVV